MSHLRNKQDVEYIGETSDKALKLISEHNIVPSPANYQVWYDYASEENMSLNKIIDDMIRQKKPFSVKFCTNLHEKFFSNDQEKNSVTTTGQGIQSELTKIAKTVADLNKGTANYGAALNDSLRSMDDVPGGEALKVIISSLLTETKDFANQNNSAQQQLKESAKTVQKLQTNLEAVRLESLTDMLTNIGNRKSFEENLKVAISKANEKDSDLCLVIGDIDHFKKFNDTWGHHVGDQVLKVVAHSMKTRVCEFGTTARYGGEEFVIILPEMSLDTAHNLTDMIRETIAKRKMKRKSTGENIGKITCSFGVAKYRPGEHRNEFLERADSALYRSKSNGRNRVTLEDEGHAKVIKIA
ncbi:MAG: GGDEF domain-containing protein [Alphaproteobacteria bacterium]|nr:MAG: GGDEF domain-containing protein [Alphaproteobacteria bacterium]